MSNISSISPASGDALFAKIASRIPGLLFQFQAFGDRTGRFPFIGEGVKALYRCEPEDMLNNAELFFKVIHPEDQQKVRYSLELSSQSLETWSCDYRIVFEDKSIHWLSGRATPERLDDGSTLWNGILSDITEQKMAEEQAIASNSFIKKVTDNLPGLVSYWTKELRCGFASNSFEEWFGKTPQTLLGSSMVDLLGSTIFKQKENRIKGVLEGSPQDFETYMTKINGERCWARTQYTPDFSEGEVIGFFVIVTDITNLKNTEIALRVSEQQASSAFEFAAIGKALISLEGRWMKVNRAISEMLGYSEEELLATTFQKMTFPPDLDEDLRLMQDLLEGKIKTYRLEKRYFHKEGILVWVLLSVSLVRDEFGAPKHFISQLQDITHQKQTLEALSQSEQRWKFALEGSGDGVWDWDIASGNLWITKKWRELLDLTEDEVGKTISEWKFRIHPGDREKVNTALNLHLENRAESFSCEYRLMAKDGSTKWILGRGVVVSRTAKGTAMRMVGSFSDITERKQLEDQLRQAQKMEMVGRLAGGVAHDFNNILTAMTLSLDDSLCSAKPDSSLWDIKGLIDQATTLTQQLLAYSKQQPMMFNRLDVNTSLKSLAKVLERLLPSNIVVKFSSSQASIYVEADQSMIEQAIMNLALNARDAMSKGGGQITLSTTIIPVDSVTRVGGETQAQNFVLVSVSDTGCGMPQEVINHLFEPFYTTKDIGKGTGLGLASTNGIIQQHRGWITVESKANEGSTFHIYLPVLEQAVAKPDSSPVNAKKVTGETILFVEDNELVRRSTVSILRRLGFNVLVANDAPTALTLWGQRSDSINMLMSDVMMPNGIDGIQLAKKLLVQKPELKVLLCSGYNRDLFEEQLVQSESITFLAKPYEVRNLTSLLLSLQNTN